MTSDAKIGLLLGLVFIFAIAFIINGLPRFADRGANSELTTQMAAPRDNRPGIAANERAATKVISRLAPAAPEPEAPAAQAAPPAARAAEDPAVRFKMPVPEVAPAASGGVRHEPGGEIENFAREPAAENRSARALPAGYVVREGDNLTAIARMFYGSGRVSETSGVKKIYLANRRILKSPDDLLVGQRIVIPAIKDVRAPGTPGAAELDGAVFENVDSIGRKTPVRTEAPPAKTRTCVVAEGDSLWKIAERQLGDGSRYGEIARLNADVLRDEDNIFEGMRLKIPAR
jgi:nucleoid-associated protein YgaU